MNERITRHLLIHGSVQGVGFRNMMEHRARKLGISGWVRNCNNGSVEAVICGNEPQIQAMLAWVRQGPPLARVSRLEIDDCEPYTLDGFIRLASV